MLDFQDKIFLITGATGSFGQSCVEYLLKQDVRTIRIYSRDEFKQWEMQKRLKNNGKLRFFIGDVRDAARLKRAAEGVDYIIHAAALKHVPICEYNPIEAIRTNIYGAINVINAALDNNVKKVIALSTDKAANPINIYGATKLCSDRLFIQSNFYRGKRRDTKFSVVRYGNVLGSRGSVIDLFHEQKKSKILTITDERMTRFAIALKDAVKFVLSSLELMHGGELFVPKLPTIKIIDLAKAISPSAKLKFIGLRPGEKIHEYLITGDEGRLAYELKDRYVLFFDSLEGYQDMVEDYKTNQDIKKMPDGFFYDSLSNPIYLSKDEIKLILKNNQLL